MAILVNVLTFRVLGEQTTGAVNISEVVTSGRTLFSKRNLGYGYNVGSITAVPSASVVYDIDLYDAPVLSPTVQPSFSTGV